MRKKLAVLLFFLVYNSLAQSDSIQIKHKKKFVSISKTEASTIKSNSERIILESDTLVDASSNKDLSNLFADVKTKDSRFLRKYKYAVFDSYNSSKNNTVRLAQWNRAILIYLDKELPKKINEEFKIFLNQFRGIKNLNIAITSKKEDANYLIYLVDEKIDVYTEDKLKYYDDEERKELTFLNMTYKLINDYGDKYYGSILKINKASVLQDLNTITKLKKVFFMSLGQFREVSMNRNSLLASKYINSEILSEFDLNMLKMHYNIIYDFKVDLKTFIELENLYANNNGN